MIMPLLQGLKITFMHLFKKPVTLQYPDERPNVAPNFRGLHALKVSHDKAKCVACYLCPTVCPAKCITVEAGEDANHDKFAAIYEIDMLRCIFCGMCEEACPKEAIFLTKELVPSEYQRELLIYGKDILVEPLDPGKRIDISKRQTPEVLEFKKDTRQKHNK